LIQIKVGKLTHRHIRPMPKSNKNSPSPNSPARPPLKNCPVCGVTMQASKSREEQAHYDVFSCLRCGTVIAQTPPNGQPAP
jgi:hypothetical protein